MPIRDPGRVLIVTDNDRIGQAESLAAALQKRGTQARVFYSIPCNTRFDRYIIHPVNHYANTLRLVSKHTNLFQGHPKSHKEFRSAQLRRLCQEYRPELLVLLRGRLGFTHAALAEVKREARLFCWFIEGDHLVREIAEEAVLYDRLYTISTEALAWAERQGLREVSLLQHAVDTDRFFPMSLPKVHDWCFLGGWSPRRQTYLRALLQVSARCVIYGAGWRRRAWRSPRLWLQVYGRGIWGPAVNRLYNQCRVVINVSSWQETGRGPAGLNMRFLEVPAAGACLLSDYAGDAERLLRRGEEFMSADTPEEMQAKLAQLLADDAERERVARRGRETASGVRTYSHVAEELCRDWSRCEGSA